MAATVLGHCIARTSATVVLIMQYKWVLNSLRPRQNGRHFADDIFKRIFLNENFWIPIKISLKFVPKGSINNILALVQIMAWRRPGDKPLSEPMMVNLPTHICVTRPQWVNSVKLSNAYIPGHQQAWYQCSIAGLFCAWHQKRWINFIWLLMYALNISCRRWNPACNDIWEIYHLTYTQTSLWYIMCLISFLFFLFFFRLEIWWVTFLISVLWYVACMLAAFH